MKLTVLAGAKEGTKIPLKKREFLIGRSSECSLRAGSDAISRRHCVLTRKDSTWTARDLGSRNGTFVNNVRIEGETPLRPGDELSVGPLRFRLDPSEKHSEVSVSSSSEAVAEATAAQDAGDVTSELGIAAGSSDVLQSSSDSASIDDEITRWLLDPDPDARSTRETQSFKMDDTNAFGIDGKPTSTQLAPAEEQEASPPSDSSESADSDSDAGEAEKDSESSSKESSQDSSTSTKRTSLHGKGKGKEPKKEAGKLPPRPTQMTKDSCEAAADILREMSRRR